jgi:hypothetical protein
MTLRTRTETMKGSKLHRVGSVRIIDKATRMVSNRELSQLQNGKSIIQVGSKILTDQRLPARSNLLKLDETILLSSPVIDRSTFNLLSKKRTLILTDLPRLICIKETSSRVVVKCEIILGEDMPLSDNDAVRFVKVEREGTKNIAVKSSVSSSFNLRF